MKVTIGLPVYNCEQHIELCIRSILQQTHSDFELIVTDDGSTDNTVIKIKSFNDKRIKLIVDGCNKGISYRLNQQIALTQTEYFFRMDGDDIMFPNRLKTQLSYLTNNPRTDVIGSSVIVIDNDNSIIGMRYARPANMISEIFTHGLFIHPTVAGKTEWFRKYCYRESLNGVEDLDLWIRSFNTSVMYIDAQPLLFYRDPLKFKYNIYAFRQSQLRKAIHKNVVLLNSNVVFIRLFIRSYAKQFLAYMCSILHIDHYLIKYRNQQLNKRDLIELLSLLERIKKSVE